MKKVSKVIENLNRLLKEDTTPISEFPTIVLKKLDIDGFSGKYKVKDKEIEFDVDSDAEAALKALQKSMDKYPAAKEFKVKGNKLILEPVVAESKNEEKELGWFVVFEGEEVADGPFDSEGEASEALDKYFDESGYEVRHGEATDNGFFISKSFGESYVDFDKALELSGMDKLSFCQKVVGQNVRLKTDNANGSIGLVVNYDNKADKLIVKLGAEKLVSVQSKDVELLNKKEDNDKVTEGFKPTKDSTIGISRTGEFTCSYKDLVNLFGPPNSEGDGYKVSTEWVLKNEETGAKLTIYDYKMTELYDEDYYTVEEFRNLPSYEWHIGSRKKEDADTLIQYLSNNIKK
jgi:hypothetical protein